MTQDAPQPAPQSSHTALEQRVCPACEAAAFRVLFAHRDRLHGLGGMFNVVQCAQCGVVSYDPLPSAAELEAFYPRDYYAYRHESSRPRNANSLRARLDDLHLGVRHDPLLFALAWPLLCYKEVYSYARFLRPIPRGRLLDVGCGDGAFLIKAQRMGFACTGLEPWGGAAVPALAQAGIPLHPITLEQASQAEGTGEATLGPFDVITLNHVFEHVIDPAAALSALRRLLAPGGRLLVRMPRTDQVFFRRRPRDWFPLEMPRHVFLYTPENFARLARRQGLRVERVIGESYPTHLQSFLKAAIFGHDFSVPHWIDARAISFALLPLCALLRALGQADCMAVWLQAEEQP